MIDRWVIVRAIDFLVVSIESDAIKNVNKRRSSDTTIYASTSIAPQATVNANAGDAVAAGGERRNKKNSLFGTVYASLVLHVTDRPTHATIARLSITEV